MPVPETTSRCLLRRTQASFLTHGKRCDMVERGESDAKRRNTHSTTAGSCTRNSSGLNTANMHTTLLTTHNGNYIESHFLKFW